MTRQLTSAVRHKLLRSPHAKRPPHGRLSSSRALGKDPETGFEEIGRCATPRVTRFPPTGLVARFAGFTSKPEVGWCRESGSEFGALSAVRQMIASLWSRQ